MAKFIDDEPVLARSAAGAVVSYVLTLLVTHGVITDTAASALTQQIVPVVAGALVMGLGVLVRRSVAPYARVKHVLESAGLVTDADFGRLQAAVEETLVKHLASAPAAVAVEPATVDPGQPAGAGAPTA